MSTTPPTPHTNHTSHTAHTPHSHTPHKERDGVHMKELGKDFLNLFKRKKKKDQHHPPPPSPHPPPPLSAPCSDTQKEDHSDPVSFQIQHLPNTPPAHSEVTQHSGQREQHSAIHVVTSATSLTEITSTGATSGESVDHDHSIEDNKKKAVREERRAFYRSKGYHIVADEDDTTEFEESHQPFRVDRRLIDRLQWKDGVTPVEFGKLRRPRFVKRREDKEGDVKLRPAANVKDAVSLEASEKKKKNRRIGSKEDLREGLSPMQSPLKEAATPAATPIEEKSPRRKKKDEKKKVDEGLSSKEGRLKEAIPLETPKKSKEEKKKEEELKDSIPLEEKKKEEKKKEEEEQRPMSRPRKKKRGSAEEEAAVEDDSDQEKRRRRKGDEGMKDTVAMESRSVRRKRTSQSHDGEMKKEEKGKDEKKEEKEKEKKSGGDEGKKKEARGGGEKDEDKKEGRREKLKEGKKKEDEDGEMKGERELREARRKEEEGLKPDDKLAVVPYEKWPVPAVLETIDGYTGYRVLTAGYKTAYFGYVCMHVSYSFVAHLFSFDFNRSVPPSIAKVVPPPPQPKQLLTPTSKSDKRDDGKSPSTTPRSTTPRSTKRIVLKKPVDYSNLSAHSSDSVEVAMCH